MRTVLVVAGLVAAVALLGGCGGDEGGTEAAGDRPASLSERLFGSTESIRSEETRIQSLIKACMERQGWKYTTVDIGSTTIELDVRSEQFVKENGYGVSTLFDKDIGFSVADDPNQKYVESLSAPERQAYQEALFGKLPSAPPGGQEGGSFVTAAALGGCLGEANKEVRGDRPQPDGKVFEQLNDLEKRVQADPRTVQAWSKWSECMAKQGFRYRNEEAVRTDLQARLTKITGQSFGGGFGSGGVIAVPGTSSSGGVTAPPKPQYDEAALSALQSEERRIALVGYECRKEHVNTVEERVRAEIEQAFVEEHPDLGGKR